MLFKIHLTHHKLYNHKPAVDTSARITYNNITSVSMGQYGYYAKKRESPKKLIKKVA